MRIKKKNKIKKIILFTFLIVSSWAIVSESSANLMPSAGPTCVWNAWIDPNMQCSGMRPVKSEEANCNINDKPLNITASCCCPAPYQTKVEEQAQINSSQARKDYQSLNFSPQISIPNSSFTAGQNMAIGDVRLKEENGGVNIYMRSDLLPRYIKAIYDYGLSFAGILAAIILMAGGILWLISGGSSDKVGQAKEMIIGSIIGLIIIFTSYILLKTVNPSLVAISTINTKIITQTEYSICCNPESGEEKIATTINNGHRVFADGDKKGQLFTCSSGYIACEGDNNQVCLKNNYGNYECQVNNVCCECGTGATFGGALSGVHKECKSHTTIENCYDWCDTLASTFFGSYAWTYANSSNSFECIDGRTLYNLGNFGVTYDVCRTKANP